jgi:hypothetical protein
MSFQPIHIDFLLNNDEVKTASDKVKKNLMDIGFTAEEAEKKINQKLNAALERQAFKTLPQLQQQGVKTQRVWNGLGNSINQLTREIPAFAVNAQTGFLAISNNIPILADEIQRLRDKNAAAVASGEKGIPIWKQLAKGFFSWNTVLSVGVALLTIYGKELVNLIGAAFKGADAFDAAKERVKALNKAFEDGKYKKTIANLLELQSVINLAKKGIIDKEVALKKYNKTLGDVAGETNNINEAEKIVEEKAPAFIKAILLRTAAMIASADAAKLLVEKQKELFTVEEDLKKNKKDSEANQGKSATKVVAGQILANTNNDALFVQEQQLNTQKKNITKKITEIKDDSVKLIEKFNSEIATIAKKFNLNLFGEDDDTNGTTKANEYQRLLDKIAAIDAEYTRKSFTKDEEEIQALQDKFAKVRALVERYNSDPKNKAKLIDLTDFNTLEDKATTDLVFRQETEKLKTNLQEQQKLYEDFENFKKTFGTESAEKEYAAKIGEAQSYYDFLKQLERENASAFTAVRNGTASGAQTERVAFISQQLQVATQKQQAEFNTQLADLISYQQQRNILIENHEKLVADLIDKGHQDKIEQAEKNHKEDLDKLDDANIKKLASYKALQRGIVGLTKQEAKVIIANAKQLLNKVNISEDLRAKIKKAIAALEQEINQRTIDNLFRYTERLGDLGDALTELGDVLGSNGVKNAGAFLSGIAGGLDDFFNVLDAQSKEEAIAAGISAAITLISTFTSAAAKRKAAEEEYYLNVIGFQNQYNIALQEQKRLQSELAENVFITDYVGRLQDGTAAIFSANEGLQDSLDKLAEKGQVIAGQRNAIDWSTVGGTTASGAAVGAAVGTAVLPVVGTAIGAVFGAYLGFVGGLFGGKKKEDSLTAILEEYPELIQQASNGLQEINTELAESLLANNLVKGETKEILENVLEWQKALEEARAQVKEVVAELAGGLGDDLRNALVDAFKAGEDAAVAMGDTVEKVLENVLSNFIFNAIFQQAFDDLQEQMATSFDVGGDNNWVDDFGRFFTSASALTDDFNKAMQDAQNEAAALGFSIFDNVNNERGIVAATRAAMTEDTAIELTGLWRGSYDLQKRHYQVVEEYLAKQDSSTTVFSNILLMLEATKVNTHLTVEELKKVNLKLIEINNKQSKQAKARDLGI